MQVVICSGGVIGACAAYFLSLRGIEVIVIERAEVAAAASGKAGGFLGLDWCADTPTKRDARRTLPAARGILRGDRRREAARMIRVERHEEVRPGIWRHTVPGFGIEGRSRRHVPTCRAIPRGTDRGRHQLFGEQGRFTHGRRRSDGNPVSKVSRVRSPRRR